MPNPAFEKLKQTVVGAVRVGEKAARTAAPVVRKAADDLRARIAKPDAAPSTPAAPVAPVAPPEPAAKAEAARPPSSGKPNPASIAKNVPHQRPVAKPPAKKKATPSDSPGGKLPPRR